MLRKREKSPLGGSCIHVERKQRVCRWHYVCRHSCTHI